MRTFRIPTKFLTGFKIISELDLDVIKPLSIILNNYNDINSNKAVVAINEKFPFLKDSSKDIVNTVYSLWELDNQIDESSNIIIDNLSVAFLEVNKDFEKNIDKLKINLGILIEQSDKQKITHKAKELLNEFDKVFLNSRIISDMRTIFSDNINDTSQKAVVVHNLKIEFSKNNANKNLFIALDINDLISLKQQIERAIEKENILIQEKHLSQLSFISLKNE